MKPPYEPAGEARPMGRPVKAQCESAGGAGPIGSSVKTHDPYIEWVGAR